MLILIIFSAYFNKFYCYLRAYFDQFPYIKSRALLITLTRYLGFSFFLKLLEKIAYTKPLESWVKDTLLMIIKRRYTLVSQKNIIKRIIV